MATSTEENDYDLLRRSLLGDTAAQRKFYERFSRVVYSICLRYMNNADDAQDLLQECMIKVFQRGKEFRFEGSLEGWIRRVSVNTCLDWLKKRKLQFTEDLESVQYKVGELHSGDTLEMKDLMKLLMQLPVGYRTVFNLFAIEGFSHAEIADLLQISENTSKSQLFKARQWLKNRLEEKN